MPSVIGSPARQYTPPSSNDEAGLTSSLPFSISPSHISRAVPGKPPPSSAFRVIQQQQQQQQQQRQNSLPQDIMSGTPASPPSSSDDSPTTSGADNNFLNEDIDMVDYDDFSHALNPNVLIFNDESSPEAIFFGNANRLPTAPPPSRFTSQASPNNAFSPFNPGLDSFRLNHSSPEFDPDGESPGLGSDMRGLRINSRYPSPVQGTVRLEDVMLPTDDTLPNLIPSFQSVSSSLFDSKAEIQHVEQGLFHAPAFDLALVGIPPNGAKSRVETQIKLDLQLLRHGTGDLVRDIYEYIKLPSYGVSKEKFRLANLKDGPKDVDPHKVLSLEASVICTSQPTKTVFICEGCILRERKRALRKKDYKRKTNKRPPPSPPLPADENQKIIVFNCPEMIEFTSGTCSLPTRITCYCRHHKEKQGFKIVLVVRDYQGNIIGRCISGNIMITDDHKAQGKTSTEGESSNKRRGSGEEGRTSGFTSRRSSLDSMDSQPQLGRKRKVASETQLPTPPLPNPVPPPAAAPSTKQIKIPRNLSMTKLNKMEPLSSTPVAKQRPGPYPQSQFMRTQSMDSVPTFFSTAAQASTPSNAGRWQTPRQQMSATAPNSRSNSPPDVLFSSIKNEPTLPDFIPQTPFSGVHSASASNAASPEDSTSISTLPQPSWTLDNMPGITIPNELDSPQPMNLNLFPTSASVQPAQPVITKMVPTEGPTAGGIEVTILGQGFTQGITAQFGEVTAIPTECYSSTTLVCLLPPSPTPGPVFVTLRDQFGGPVTETVRVEQQQLFTYVNTTDRALMELALQIMGFKWLGKLEDARNVAAMIIGSNNSGGGPGPSEMAALGGAGLENTLLRCLDVVDQDVSPHPAKLAQKSATGHTMLHLAAMAGMRKLVAALLVRGVNPTVRDRAGFTALHYAAWLGRKKVLQRLLSGDKTPLLLAMKNLEGKTAMDLAVETGRLEICQLLESPVPGSLSRASSVASLVSLGENLSRASLDDYFAGSEWDESTYGQSNPNSDGENVEEDEDGLWLGSLRPSSEESSGLLTPASQVRRRGFFHLSRPQLPQRLQLPRPQLPDPQALNPALYMAALNDLLQPYLQALRLTNSGLSALPRDDSGTPSSDEKKYDQPPPAYSELYPVPVAKKQFSLATRLSLRGRSFLRWTGMAGDAGLSAEEIEFLKSEEGRRKAWSRDYMLIFFWIPVLVCFVGFTLVKGYNAVCGIGGAAMETLSADRIVEV